MDLAEHSVIGTWQLETILIQGNYFLEKVFSNVGNIVESIYFKNFSSTYCIWV